MLRLPKISGSSIVTYCYNAVLAVLSYILLRYCYRKFVEEKFTPKT